MKFLYTLRWIIASENSLKSNRSRANIVRNFCQGFQLLIKACRHSTILLPKARGFRWANTGFFSLPSSLTRPTAFIYFFFFLLHTLTSFYYCVLSYTIPLYLRQANGDYYTHGPALVSWSSSNPCPLISMLSMASRVQAIPFIKSRRGDSILPPTDCFSLFHLAL